MRLTSIGLALLACLSLAACSTGGGGENPYAAPDMGSASALPAGAYATSVASAPAGLAMLQDAMWNVSSLVDATPKTAPAAKYTLVTNSAHYAFSSSTPGVTATGSADASIVNFPMGSPEPADSMPVNASMNVTQQLTVTTDHVAQGSYWVSGKMVCNLSMSLTITGTYGTPVADGSLKIGYGIAGTIDDDVTSRSAKFILSFSVETSLSTMSGYLPVSGTLYVYNAQTDALIDSMTVTGTDLADLITITGLG
jgi:hypothetical protein